MRSPCKTQVGKKGDLREKSIRRNKIPTLCPRGQSHTSRQTGMQQPENRETGGGWGQWEERRERSITSNAASRKLDMMAQVYISSKETYK